MHHPTMARKARFAWTLFTAAVAMAQAKSLNSAIDESINEIDYGEASLKRNDPLVPEEQRDSVLPTRNEEPTQALAVQADAADSTAGTVIDTAYPTEASTIKPGLFSWFLTPLAQKIQFSPQTFLQDRLIQLKETLSGLGINVIQNATAKQLGANLVHFVGPNDSGFYTNRLEPAGFLGGNGWFANKGGILGGPGAIVSTGSLLTDYQTPYRK